MNLPSPLPRTFCFVLMPFSAEFKDIYRRGIRPACTKAGACCERVDEQVFGERILDQIYDQISKADIIIADISGRNSNVFYEVGYAHALEKPAILLTQSAGDIPFDLKHFPHIVYGSDVSLLRKELARHLALYIENSTGLAPQGSLAGKWILGIYEPAGAFHSIRTIYKVDGYNIRQVGRTLKGTITRLCGPGVAREYDFSGYTDGRELVYSFWSKRIDVHSWGCCNLERTDDFQYEGFYFWPQGKAGHREPTQNRSGEKIILVRADHIERVLKGQVEDAVYRQLLSWATGRKAVP